MMKRTRACHTRPWRRMTDTILTPALMCLVRLYQGCVRPLLGGSCRFYPTCSEYALEALRQHGPYRGTVLTVKRLLRCRPFGGCGYDPVPPADRSAAAPHAAS